MPTQSALSLPSQQVITALRHDADLTQIAAKVLEALDHYVAWESTGGARHLAKLMPEFRRAVNHGELDPTRCPYDDDELETFTDADEHGVRTFFTCHTAAHTFPALTGTNGEVPDFSEYES